MKSDTAYTDSRLPMPDANYPNAGLILANDEVALAAIRSAGTMYLTRAISSAKQPTRAVVGGDRIFDLGTRLDQITHPLRHHAWRSGLAISYDADGRTRLPSAPPLAGPPICRMGKGVTYDWSNRAGHIEVNTPSARGFVGFADANVTVGDATISGVNRPFVHISCVAEDGLPLEKSASILVTLAAKSTNTEFAMDVTKMKQLWAPGLAEAIANVGKPPVVVDRVHATITAPWLKGMHYAKQDFSRRTYATGPITDTLTITADEPMFTCRLTRTPARQPTTVPQQ